MYSPMKNPLLFFCLIFPNFLMSQNTANYDEKKVPDISIPDLFVSGRGDYIRTVADWEKIRRPEIISLFTENVYGPITNELDDIRFDLINETENPYPEISVLKEVDIKVSRQGNQHSMNLKVFLPRKKGGPFPVFLLISHRNVMGLLENMEDEFFPVADIIGRGYAAAIFDVEDVSPDDKKRFTQGILDTLYPEQLNKANGMRGLAAWAWGAARAMDYFEKNPDINETKAIVVGHSRGGKAALWAGANDSRWAITVANESGCGGAALSKRKFGETVERINSSFPYWFNDNFKTFNGKEECLPFDQHQLIATIAPRAVYVASAIEDQWSDPKGEFLSLKLGSRVYSEIYGRSLDFSENFQNSQRTIHKPSVGYHLRDGIHNLNLHDWERFMDFTDMQFDED